MQTKLEMQSSLGCKTIQTMIKTRNKNFTAAVFKMVCVRCLNVLASYLANQHFHSKPVLPL